MDLMKMAPALLVTFMTTLGCSGSDTASTGGGGTGGTGGTGGGGGAGGGSLQNVRGDRYCEVLIGHLDGATIHLDVYNTYLLNECPEGAWKALDAAAIKMDYAADAVVLNGPRYWLMDAFENSKVIDTTPVTFGALEMRLSGKVDVLVAEVMGGEKPYTPRTVARTTTWVYDAGKPVYELVNPEGQIFDMQSYSVQKSPQTEATLADLASQLTLPAGWTFQTRTLGSPLTVTTVDGMATVVQDDFANTYQLSQQ